MPVRAPPLGTARGGGAAAGPPGRHGRADARGAAAPCDVERPGWDVGCAGRCARPGESAVDGALREAHEEAGIDPGAVGVRGVHVLDHGDWAYTTVLADGLVEVHPSETDAESIEVTWVALDQVPSHPLLPAFAQAWPTLRARLETR
ncbi:NUDIX domain-containing protein [Cellulomonas soli]